MASTKNRKISRRAMLGGAAALTVTVGGGAAWAADRFLIPHVEVTDTTAYEASQAGATSSASATSAASSSQAAEVTGDSYTREGLELKITKTTTGSGSDTITYFVADAVLGDAANLRTAFANNQFGTNITANVSTIANAHEAKFAINGDYYGFRDTGIVIRNGAKYRDEPARQGLAFYSDGSLKLYDETSTNADTLIADGVQQTWSFGPGIVDGGSVVSGIENFQVDTNIGNHSIQGQQPRTGVGIIDDNHLLFVVVDGRSEGYSRGVTMTEFAEIFVSLGAKVAYNLDGGGSSEMWFNGQVLNRPSQGGKERATSDILYFA